MPSETKLDSHGFAAYKKPPRTTCDEEARMALTAPFPVSIPNQNFTVISYLGPCTKPSQPWFGLRIYGTFATEDEAAAAITTAQSKGFTEWDMYIVDTSRGFFPLPPPCDADMMQVEYQNNTLTSLMRGYLDVVKMSNDRVQRRAQASMDNRSIEEVFNEMAQVAVQHVKAAVAAGQTDNTLLTGALVEQFKRISKYIQD
jgi:hypothetical protein